MGMRRYAIKVSTALFLAAVSFTACNWHLKTRTPPASVQAGAPAFALPDHEGTSVSLDALTQNGPAVIVFYRGYW